MTSVVAGMVMMLGLLGAFGSGSGAALTAPHDTVVEAARGILPDAQIAVHGNLQAAMAAFDELVAEVGKLRLIAGDKDLSAGFAVGRAAVDSALERLRAEAGIDLRKDVGSVTLSFAFPSADEVRMLVRLRGNLGAARIEERLAKPDSPGVDFQGVRLHGLPDADALRDHVLAMVDATTLVIGERELVQDIVAKKAWKMSAKQAGGRLAASLRKGTRGFVYLAPPSWAVDAVREEPHMKAAADLLGGVDHLIYQVGTDGAQLKVLTRDATAGRQIGHLLKASAAVLTMLEPATDALVHGWLGVAPMMTDADLDPLVRAALSDEAAVEELGGWVKSRFGGKAAVKVDGKGTSITMELSNPASLGSLMLPVLGGAGAAVWWRSSDMEKQPTESPETFD